jgi:hypothetical protein
LEIKKILRIILQFMADKVFVNEKYVGLLDCAFRIVVAEGKARIHACTSGLVDPIPFKGDLEINVVAE